MAGQGHTGRGDGQGDERPAAEPGQQPDAVRWEADDIWGIRAGAGARRPDLTVLLTHALPLGGRQKSALRAPVMARVSTGNSRWHMRVCLLSGVGRLAVANFDDSRAFAGCGYESPDPVTTQSNPL